MIAFFFLSFVFVSVVVVAAAVHGKEIVNHMRHE